MKTLLLILGKETNEFAKGNYNQSLFAIAVETLKDRYLTTVFLNSDSSRNADDREVASLASNPG